MAPVEAVTVNSVAINQSLGARTARKTSAAMPPKRIDACRDVGGALLSGTATSSAHSPT